MSILDDRKFDGIVLECGKTSGDPDTLTFKDGRFRSSACDQYGYGDGPYTATRSGESLVFEAETESPKYGKLLWKGVVRGPRLDGTMTMVRDGRAAGEKWILAGEKKMNGAPAQAYHEGMRQLQDRCDTRKLADRLDEKLGRTTFTAEDRAFIESRPLFFLATADGSGQPDCSYKGGAPGFVRVTGDAELAFPSYDGNGMFRSLGNVLVNPAVALLFIDFERPSRLRVNGSARMVDDDPLLASFPGAQFVVRVHAARIFPNCPRYIHRMTIVETSPYVPREGYVPPIPKWKRFDDFADVLPHDDPARSTVG